MCLWARCWVLGARYSFMMQVKWSLWPHAMIWTTSLWSGLRQTGQSFLVDVGDDVGLIEVRPLMKNSSRVEADVWNWRMMTGDAIESVGEVADILEDDVLDTGRRGSSAIE